MELIGLPPRLRTILHVDLDAFYAQVEMRDEPSLRDKPLIIGRDPALTHGRGVVATANYVARQFGVHSAQSVAEAKRLAPNAVFLTPDFTKYQAISAQIHAIFRRFTAKIEPMSLDEAYLDVSERRESGVQIAAQIRQMILAETGLTCSIGVATNKLLAKLGSEYNKPNGLTVLTAANVDAFLASLPIGDFRGVGAKTRAVLEDMHITNGADLRALTRETLTARFGKFGESLYFQARGWHFSEVDWQHERQSIGKEVTYDVFLQDEAAVSAAWRYLAARLIAAVQKKHVTGRTLTVKIRDADFQTITRSLTLSKPWLLEVPILVEQAQTIFDEHVDAPFAIRLLGLSLSNLSEKTAEEIALF